MQLTNINAEYGQNTMQNQYSAEYAVNKFIDL